VSVLAHCLERLGLATTLVALVHRHAEGQKPPRALWVPYWYGRTFGAPNNSGLQMRVLRATLDLLERPSGPVLESFEEDAPATADPDGWSPPMNLEAADESMSNADLADRLERDIATLTPPHEEAVRADGWTLVGLSGRSLSQMAAIFASYLRQGPTDDIPKRERAHVIKYGSQDFTDAFSQTAAHLGGDAPFAIRRWYWTRSSFGLTMRRLGELLPGDPDAKTRLIAQGMLVPREWKL
jgi:hypothetical protein